VTDECDVYLGSAQCKHAWYSCPGYLSAWYCQDCHRFLLCIFVTASFISTVNITLSVCDVSVHILSGDWHVLVN